MHGGRHSAQVTLAGEQLTEGVCDVDDPDAGGVDPGVVEGVVDDLAGESGEVDLVTAEIAGEIALVAAENPDILHGGDVTTTKRVTKGNQRETPWRESRFRFPPRRYPWSSRLSRPSRRVRVRGRDRASRCPSRSNGPSRDPRHRPARSRTDRSRRSRDRQKPVLLPPSPRQPERPACPARLPRPSSV